MVFDIAILVLALAVLIASGSWIVRLLSNITATFGLSEFTAAFFLLAVATSIPELFLAISSAQQEAGEIVFAIALGSNVVNITLIVGLAALLAAGINIQGRSLRKNIVLSICLSLLPLVFLVDGVISRFEGGLLVAAFFAYMVVIYRNRPPADLAKKMPHHIMRGIFSIFLLFGLLALLLVAADKTIISTVALAEAWRISPFLVGVFLLAVGTSLPELTTTLQSIRHGKPGIALGNILGSDAADSTLVVGVASLFAPLHVPMEPHIIITIVFVVIANALLGYMTVSRRRISIPESLFLLALFALFVFIMVIFSPYALLGLH